MEKKYGALRVISNLYKVIAVIIFLLAILGTIGSAISLITTTSRYTGFSVEMTPLMLIGIAEILGILLGGIIAAISLYAFANLIDLLIATEENTRMTAALLNRLGRPLQPPSRPAPTIPVE